MSALDVDGPRPGVAAVAALPRAYRLRDAEWRVLMVLACDSFDGVETAPGYDNLAAWTGLLRSTAADAVARLLEPTENRPALLERAETTRGRNRTVYRLLLDGMHDFGSPTIRGEASTTDRLSEPSGHTGRLDDEPSGHADRLGNRPTTPDGWGDEPSGEPSGQPSGEPSGQPSGEPSGETGRLPSPSPYPLPSPSTCTSPRAREDVDAASRNDGGDHSAVPAPSPAGPSGDDRDNDGADTFAVEFDKHFLDVEAFMNEDDDDDSDGDTFAAVSAPSRRSSANDEGDASTYREPVEAYLHRIAARVPTATDMLGDEEADW